MKKLFLIAALATSCAAVQAAPIYTAVGIQNDVRYDTVVNGGWKIVYRGDYAASFSVSTLANSIAAGTNVMLAAILDNSLVFDVLGYAKKEEVFQYTLNNQVHAANGAVWYFNDRSMGFAGAGDTISQSSADVKGRAERDRLSWHTAGSIGAITTAGGWRSGSNIELNASTAWDRVILVQVAQVAQVPEPASVGLLGLGLLGLAAVRRHRQA